MSIYIPKQETTSVQRGTDNWWWVHDQFGAYDGPYSTASDAWAVVEHLFEEGYQEPGKRRIGQNSN